MRLHSMHVQRATPQGVLDSYRPGLVVVTLIAVVGLLLSLTGVRRNRAAHSVVVARSTAREADAEPVPVRD